MRKSVGKNGGHVFWEKGSVCRFAYVRRAVWPGGVHAYRAAQVRGPMIPSGVSPFICWKAVAVRAVAGP